MLCSFLSNPLIPSSVWVQGITNPIVQSEEVMYPLKHYNRVLCDYYGFDKDTGAPTFLNSLVAG